MGLAAVALCLTAVLQGSRHTVGDTVWVEIQVTIPKRHILRAQQWDLGDLGQTLGPPAVTIEGDQARVRYPVAIWYPGQHSLDVPGPVIVTQEGRSDTLPNRKVTVNLASVLPPGAARDTLPPKDAAGLVDQSVVAYTPAIILALISVLSVGLGYWIKERRRRRAAASQPLIPAVDVPPMLARWVEVGELRAALDGYTRLIERALEGGKGGSGTPDELRTVLSEAELIGFQGDPTTDEVAPVLAKVEAFHRQLAT